MKKDLGNIGTVLIVVAIGFLTNVIFPSAQNELSNLFHKVIPPPTPLPSYVENTRTLTKDEISTMSGNFMQEFTELVSTRAARWGSVAGASTVASPPATSTPPATKDTVAPIVAINGGPVEGSTVAETRVCFPLWVSDNATEYTKLLVQAKFDTQQITAWSNTLQYCYESLANGPHTFSVQVKDEAGNVTESKRSFTVTK